jgi:hypothetical protein
MSKSDAPAPITLVFEGVMIARPDENKHIYEMGVLPVPNHSFTIEIIESRVSDTGIVKKTQIDFSDVDLPSNTAWLLSTTSIGRKNANMILKRDAKRPDRTKSPLPASAGATVPTKFDHRWVPDLTDDTDFPNHLPKGNSELPVFSGLLKPVLVITTGEFYAAKITTADDGQLKRRQGNGGWSCFGFAPEQVKADVKGAIGEELVLQIESTKEELFRLRIQQDKFYEVFFRNTPPNAKSDNKDDGPTARQDRNRPSHFQLLYLFINLPPEQRYEVRLRPDQKKCPGEEANPLAKKSGTVADLMDQDISALAEALKTASRDDTSAGVPKSRCAAVALKSSKSLLS